MGVVIGRELLDSWTDEQIIYLADAYARKPQMRFPAAYAQDFLRRVRLNFLPEDMLLFGDMLWHSPAVMIPFGKEAIVKKYLVMGEGFEWPAGHPYEVGARVQMWPHDAAPFIASGILKDESATGSGGKGPLPEQPA